MAVIKANETSPSAEAIEGVRDPLVFARAVNLTMDTLAENKVNADLIEVVREVSGIAKRKTK